MDGVEVGGSRVVSLGVGRGVSLGYSWEPSCRGDYSVRVVLDVLDEVSESDESNNVGEVGYAVERVGPDYRFFLVVLGVVGGVLAVLVFLFRRGYIVVEIEP